MVYGLLDTPVKAPTLPPTTGARAATAGTSSTVVTLHLLRSAVALQAEGLLRTAGALAGTWGGVLDRTSWIERDARDLSELTAVAVAAGARLPAGMDNGAGDPDHPHSAVEGLLAGHEALVTVLRELVAARPDDDSAAAPGWQAAVDAVLHRREEEMELLRRIGAKGHLPPEHTYVHGTPPT